MTLRRRLLAVLLATVAIALAIVGVSTYVLVARSQLSQIDDDLQSAHPPIERAATGDPATRAREIRDAAPGFYAELRDATGSSLLVVPLRDRDGDVLSLEGIDLPAPDGREGDDGAVFTTIHLDGDEVVRARVSVQDGGEILVIARSMEELLHTRRNLLVVLLTTGVGAMAAAALLGSWLVRATLRPLREVEQAAAAIGDGDLARRVPGDEAPTEVGELARTINHMLTRLEQAFEQREHDLAALQESEARMRRFVADASHELRTPIAATAAYAELFERGARDRPDDLARAMTGIRGETARMAALVEDLLLLARVDEDRPFERVPVDLCDTVVEAVQTARTVAPDRAIELRLDDVAVVDGDPVRLRQVVDNLLANVRTHTPPGTSCTVTVGIDGDDAVVTVGDDGPGMSPDDAARAFNRFHRADTSRTRASGGSGLGLSIVAGLVAAHGGRAELESTPGVGTTIRIRIPTRPNGRPT